MAFAMSTTASAQFGGLGKKLKEKAKRALNNEVNKAEYEAKEAAEAKAKEAVTGESETEGGTTQSGTLQLLGGDFTDSGAKYPNPDKKYEPSAEAKAKDPKASSTELRFSSQKTMAEIRGAYEQLDPETYPLQPYYDFPYFYNMDDGTEPKDQYNETRKWLVEASNIHPAKLPHILLSDFPGINKDNPKAKYAIPAQDVFCYKWITSYVCDPDNFGAFILFTNTLPFYGCKTFDYKFEYTYENEKEGIIDSSKGMMEMKDWNDKANSRLGDAIALAQQRIPLERMLKRLQAVISIAENSQESVVDRVYNFAVAECMYSYLFNGRRDYNTFSQTDEYRLLEARYDKIAPEISQIARKAADAAEEAALPTVEMPKSVSVSAATRTEVTKFVKTEEPTMVEVLFKTANWRPFKSAEWPYKVTHHLIEIYVVTKEDGKYWIRETAVSKFPSGKLRLAGTTSQDTRRYPLNYKK